MQDVTDDESAMMPIVLDRKRLTEAEAAQVWEEGQKALNQMNALAAQVNEEYPWRSQDAEKLDAMTVQQWIDGCGASDLTKRLMKATLAGDNGQDTSRQSLLGQLAAVKGGGLERYWTDSEVYRCKGGNDKLATMLARAIGSERIVTGVYVRTVWRTEGRMIVDVSDDRQFECDDVVLATPPTTWGKVNFAPALPSQMMPQMGVAAKHFSIVKERFWEKSTPKLSQYGVDEEFISSTWDATDGQGEVTEGGAGAVLVSFHGGPACRGVSAMDRQRRDATMAKALEGLFPGYKQQVEKTTYMNWPSEPFALGGYSFPAPGQVTSVGPLMNQAHMEGHLFLAGEHTCYKFVGYMEGALQSGIWAARAIATRDLVKGK
jgi:monoamine oxidase